MVLRKIKDMGPNIHTTMVILQFYLIFWKNQITWEVIEVLWFGSFMRTVGPLMGLPRTGTGDPLKFKEPPDAGVVTACYLPAVLFVFSSLLQHSIASRPVRSTSFWRRIPFSLARVCFLSFPCCSPFSFAVLLSLYPAGGTALWFLSRSLANQEISQVSGESATFDCYCRVGKFERVS